MKPSRLLLLLKATKIGRKPDWDKLVEVVTEVVRDILADNENKK